MASRLGVSRRSKHIEIKYLWSPRRDQRGQTRAQEGRNSLQSFRCSHKICSSISSWSASSSSQYLQGSFTKVKISPFVSTSSSISSAFIPPSATLYINFTDHVDAVVSLHVLCQLRSSRISSSETQSSVKTHQENSHTSSSRGRRSRRIKRSSSSACQSSWCRSSRESRIRGRNDWVSSREFRYSCSWSAIFSSSSESRVDESAEIIDQIMLQCISVIERIVMEKKARSRKESGESWRGQSTTITSLSSSKKNHVICLVLLSPLQFCRFLVQFSSSVTSTICSEVKCSALCHWIRLGLNIRVRAISLSITCLIAADHFSSHISDHGDVSSDQVSSWCRVISAQPSSAIRGCGHGVSWSNLIVNAQDQPALESAEIRTDIAISGLIVSGSSAPDSLVKYAIMASLPSWRMDMCHLSDDVKLFASNFKTSGDTLDFKQFVDSQAQRHWPILSEVEFKLFSQHHVLQVPRVKEPSGGHVLNWKIHQSLQDAIYHMIYLTVAHCVRHGSPASSSDLSTVYTIVSGVMLPSHLQHFEEENLYGIKSFNLKSHAPGHLRLSSFMDQLQLFRAFTLLLGSSGGPSQFMSSHVLYYESVSISDRYVSQSLSCIISHRTARLNERVHSLMLLHHPHLLMVFFQSSPGHEMEFKHSVTEFTVKPSFFIEALVTSPHLEGFDQMASQSAMQISSPSSFNAQPSSSLMVKSAVINIRWSASA